MYSHIHTQTLSLRVLGWWLFMGRRPGWAISGSLINHTGCRPLISSTGREESSASAPCCFSSASLLPASSCLPLFLTQHLTSFLILCLQSRFYLSVFVLLRVTRSLDISVTVWLLVTLPFPFFSFLLFLVLVCPRFFLVVLLKMPPCLALSQLATMVLFLQ